MTIAVIGGGLFGSVIARHLRKEKHDVVVFDSRRKDAGFRPSACLMKPSWMTTMSSKQIDKSLLLLDEIVGVRELEFRVPLTKVKVYWANPRKLALPADGPGYVQTKVTDVSWDKTARSWKIGFLKEDRVVYVHYKTVIAAAGVWCNDVLPKEVRVPELVGKAGCAFTWTGQLKENFISVWAPYKQVVGFNWAKDEVWCGDGSAILAQNWTDERREENQERCEKAVLKRADGELHRHKLLFGIRPSTPKVEGQPCYLKEVLPGLWVATGGAKNGTIAAAWCAYEISRQLQ